MVFFGTEVRWSGREVLEIVHLYNSTSVSGDGHTLGGGNKEATDGNLEGKDVDAKDTSVGGGTTAREAVVESRRDSSHNYGFERKVRTS